MCRGLATIYTAFTLHLHLFTQQHTALGNVSSWGDLSIPESVLLLSHLFVTLWTGARQLPCPWGSPGKNPGVGCPFLFQGIFPAKGQNPHLLYLLCLPLCRQFLYLLSHSGRWRSLYTNTRPLYTTDLGILIVGFQSEAGEISELSWELKLRFVKPPEWNFQLDWLYLWKALNAHSLLGISLIWTEF